MWEEVESGLWVVTCPNCLWHQAAKTHNLDAVIGGACFPGETYRQVGSDTLAAHLADHLSLGAEIDIATGVLV